MSEVSEMSSTPEELLASGRRHLAVRDYTAAAESLATACELLAKKHGEFADECAEAYLWYGKSLLGLSREETGLYGDGVAGANKEGEENDDENGGENAKGEQKNGEVEAEGDEENKVKEGDEENKVEDAIDNEKNEPESTTKDEEPGVDNEEKPGTSNGDVNEDSLVNLENEDDVDNLQLAWEMLDLSRNILQKRSDSGHDVRSLLAEVHLALGEVALESETYDKAVADMISCLDIQKELYKSDDRHIAETHYQIGLANSLASNFDDAITHFKNAANILETRIKTLENPKTLSECATVKKYVNTDPSYSVEGEIKELKELLPEIQEKIQDMMDYKAETIKRVREALCPTNGESSNGASSRKTEQKASDISHLIKRKRKNSEEGGSAPKRANK